MTSLPPLPAAITATCRDHFGSRARRYRDNRCDSCPLRTPCVKWGAVPGHSIEQLVEARGVFVREAEEVANEQ